MNDCTVTICCRDPKSRPSVAPWPGVRRLSAKPAAIRPLTAVLAALLGWVQADGCLAHGTATPDTSVTAPLPSGFLAESVVDKTQARGAYKVRIKNQLASQVYQNGGNQHYLLTDVIVKVPTRDLGITNKSAAQAAQFTMSYFHAGSTTPYAECTLIPRTVNGSSATYSLGLKSNALLTMVRWGLCDDPTTPGYQSVFPETENNDFARLVGPGGQAIAEFPVPIAFDQPLPPRPKKKPQPSIAKTMETGRYKVKKQ